MLRSKSDRVVITGLGVVSPLGCEPESLWQNVQAGKSGISPLRALPAAALPIHFGAEVHDFTGDIENYGPLDNQLKRAIKKNMKVMCREIEMGVAVSQKAIAHAGLTPSSGDPQRTGVLFGCDYILTRPEEYSDGAQHCRDEQGVFHIERWPVDGLPKVNPLWLLKYLPNMPNSHVAIYNDFRGPNNSLTVREASMSLAVAEAYDIILRGGADVMVVGSTGTRIHPLRTTHAVLVESLASNQADPTSMSRPFDESSDGMVLGEGAGALVLESHKHAQARGAKIWGEILGAGSAMVGPRGDRDFLEMAISLALGKALDQAGDRLPASWHVHAHGLSVAQCDASEAGAISQQLKRLGVSAPVVAGKSYYGNLGAGSGAIELVLSMLAMEHGRLFPIRNLKQLRAEAHWQPATATDSAGDAFAHIAYTGQGQAASLVIARP
ncbi:MAG: beta-ketoacyl-[acyl-carrier-protein] synthase family protein [Pirellulaceae bacterium]|nr:beta-ketoacyl-[acyl-carrier-protein] synthase family protein [Pirellulaceae bacterium]